MAVMEFWKQNILNTTTMATSTAGNGAGTFAYAFDRNLRLKYTTVGYNSNTIAAFAATFSAATPVSGVLVQNHNLRQFRLYYNSVTANSLAVVAGNSATSTYISFATVTVNSVELEMELQMSSGAVQADIEKSFGELVIGDRLLAFERNPSHGDWKPVRDRKQIVHEMPDGGVKVLQVQDKYRADLRWHFITETFRNNLYTVWSSAAALYFLPFPTTTGWGGDAFEMGWIGNFDFTHEDNSKNQGYVGSIRLRETTGG